MTFFKFRKHYSFKGKMITELKAVNILWPDGTETHNPLRGFDHVYVTIHGQTKTAVALEEVQNLIIGVTE